MAFMQPQVFKANYFQVHTSCGIEIVLCDDCGRTVSTHVEALLNYLEGSPDDPDELCEVNSGWVARMSAPGYLDCTAWTAHASESAALAYLNDMYEDEDEDESV